MPEKYVIMGDSKIPSEEFYKKVINGWDEWAKTYEPVKLTEAEKRIFKKSCLVNPEERDKLFNRNEIVREGVSLVRRV